MSAYESEYLPPLAGDLDHADPNFRARLRPCGKCLRPFTTSAKWRYFCPHCRRLAAALSTEERQPARVHLPGALGRL